MSTSFNGKVYINLTGIVAIRKVTFKDEVKRFDESHYLESTQDRVNTHSPFSISTRVRFSLKCDLEFPPCASSDLGQTQDN